MINIYMHDKNNNKKILIYYFCSIILLICYGIYKNGILLYQHHLINLITIFKPLILVLIPFIIDLLFNYLSKKKLVINYDTFYWSCIGLFIPTNTNILFYTIVIFACKLIFSKIKIKFNYYVLTKLIIILILIICNKYSYINPLESSVQYSFSIIDLLWGRSIGGICSTSFIYALICYIVLSLSKCYKNSIPIISFIVFAILNGIIMIINNNFDFSGYVGVFLSLSIFGSDNRFTPYLPKARILYSVSLGILTTLLSLINIYEGVFIAILIFSFVFENFDKLIYSLKKDKK